MVSLQDALRYFLPGSTNAIRANKLEKELKLWQHALLKHTRKPAVGEMFGQSGIIFSREAESVRAFYDIHDQSVVLRTCCMAIRDEIFRRGGKWIPAFAAKCNECDKEFDVTPGDEKCDECGSADLREPDPQQRDDITDFLFTYINGTGNTNTAGQSLWDVLKNTEDDINIADNAYILFVKNYITSPQGKIIKKELKEIIRINPVIMRIVADTSGARGGLFKRCPIHSNIIESISQEDNAEILRCKKCGAILKDVHYMAIDHEGKKNYYIKGEILHWMKYSPSIYYGTSPILTLWKQATTLIQMEDYNYSAYSKRRIPSGVLNMISRNAESALIWWRKQIAMVSAEREYIPITVQDPDTAVGKVEFIKFMDSLREMEYIPVRDEIRQRISSMYGVSNIFMGDVSTSGGLNNEGLQILVTNRAVEKGQMPYNQKVFPAILSSLEITDWKYELLPSEEKDEMAELQRDNQKMLNAREMLEMGFNIELKETEELTFMFSGTAKQLPSFDISQDPRNSVPNEQAPPPGVNQTTGLPDKVKSLPDNLIQKAELEAEELQKTFWDRAISAIQAGTLYDAYSGLSRKRSEELNRMIFMMFKQPKWDSTKLMRDITRKFKLSKEDAEQIVRTEMTAVTNKAREMSYNDRMKTSGETYKFDWVGPDDHNTTKECTEIKNTIYKEGRGNGVTLQRIKQIVHDVSKKYSTKKFKYRELLPHIGCRHKLLRVMIATKTKKKEKPKSETPAEKDTELMRKVESTRLQLMQKLLNKNDKAV